MPPKASASREALAAAAEFQDLTVQHVQPEQAGGEPIAGLVARIGRAAGPPWAADQRHAAAAAQFTLGAAYLL